MLRPPDTCAYMHLKPGRIGAQAAALLLVLHSLTGQALLESTPGLNGWWNLTVRSPKPIPGESHIARPEISPLEPPQLATALVAAPTI
jgi:hypothetical protein